VFAKKLTGHTVAGDSVDSGWTSTCRGGSSPVGSSSSISVISVPFEVTGEGPTISLGLNALDVAGEVLRSSEFG
jgi:hypothetical protein